MEGDSPELEIDSELVMSFYDQYQADDLACKVYGVDGVKTEHDAISLLHPSLRSPSGPFSHHSGSGAGLCSVSASIIELKPANVSGSGLSSGPDVSSISGDHGPVSPCHVVGSGNSWNLPDLLVGLDGITARDTSSESSVSGDSPDTCSGQMHDVSPVSSNHLLTSTIPCISLPSLDLPDHNDSNQDPSRHPSQSVSPFYFDPVPGYPGQGSRPGATDSLLDSLGILSSPAQGGASVKTEMVSCPSPPPHYTIVDSRVDTPITMDLSQLVSHHNIPAQFELNLSPKCEPLVHTQTNSIPISSSFSLSNITNLASVSIANIDPGLLGRVTQLQGATVPSQLGPGALSLDLIAQHCTLLPPELVSLPPGIPGAPGLLAPATTFISQEQDIVNNNITDNGMDFTPVHIKEEEECVSPPLAGELSPVTKGRGAAGGPVYKRCHLCVRIFSTKANLSSHIRHVHMGEAKHSRVKSIPCPHCNKMFSRKGHMTEHVRTVHEGKKRIYKEVNCQHCGKTFRRKWGLNIHISSAHADVINAVVKQ